VAGPKVFVSFPKEPLPVTATAVSALELRTFCRHFTSSPDIPKLKFRLKDVIVQETPVVVVPKISAIIALIWVIKPSNLVISACSSAVVISDIGLAGAKVIPVVVVVVVGVVGVTGVTGVTGTTGVTGVVVAAKVVKVWSAETPVAPLADD